MLGYKLVRTEELLKLRKDLEIKEEELKETLKNYLNNIYLKQVCI